MKYLLLGHAPAGARSELSTDEKRNLHGRHAAFHKEFEAAAGSPITVIAHYRLRPARHVTTLRGAANEPVSSEGPLGEASESLRALYLLDSADNEAVLDFASRLPAVRLGGAVEIWPLIEPGPP